MKKFSIWHVFVLLLVCSTCRAQTATSVQTTTVPWPTSYTVVSRDANSCIWERTNYIQGPNGQVIAKTHHYTELATGLNFQDPTTGQWTPSKEEIDILPDGSAVAANGQHRAYFPADIYNGAIKLVTPDGLQLQSQPIGLSYDDGSNTVLIAELTNSVGQLIGSNQIIYTDAFVGVDADLLYTYTKAGLEQDVILDAQPPTPESYGLNPQTTRLQLVTEFFNPPQPAVTTTSLPDQAGLALTDDTLDFGMMKLIQGRAFLLGNNQTAGQVMVGKQWLSVNGRQFLVEEVPVAAIGNQLSQLPAAQISSFHAQSPLNIVSAKRLLPPPRFVKSTHPRPIQVARAGIPRRGFLLDYQAVNGSLTNYTFQGDTTYYISGSVDLYGTNTFEGGTVLKYTNGASINIATGCGINWLGAPYRPVILTAMDDNSVGDTISGSTGNPTNDYAAYALSFNSVGPFTLSNFRISYAANAIGDYQTDLNLYDGQFVNDQFGVEGIYYANTLRNVLMTSVSNDFTSVSSSIDSQNSTFSGSAWLNPNANSASMSFENCIFANVTNLTSGSSSTLTGTNNGFYESPAFGTNQKTNTFYPFQTVGGGNYYLTTNCAFIGVGTANIDPTLLAYLATKTTYPPTVYADMTLTTNLNLSPTVPRDNSGTPSLGYHYDSLDYAFGFVFGTNATITINPGTDIGLFSTNGIGLYGIGLTTGAGLICQGLANDAIQMVEFNTVQECGTNWAEPTYAMVTDAFSGGPAAGISAVFTHWSVMAQDMPHGSFLSDDAVNFQNCEFSGGELQENGQGLLNFTNCLFQRVYAQIASEGAPTFQNNLFWNGTFQLASATNALVDNNLFDHTIISPPRRGQPAQTSNAGYNAYVTNCNTLTPVNPSDVILSNSPAYETSWFGNYYLPTNSPLLQAGSTNANLLGLYHFTTQTNQIPEGTSVVDIGYHYVATDTNGIPLDSNGDGIPDYLEDPLGNGLSYNGTNWALAILIEPTNQTVMQSSNISISVTAGGVPPLTYQWYFNSIALANQTNSTLIFNPVLTNNAGNYFVIVTNSFGAVTSSIATLTVLAPPVVSITNPANNQIIIASSTNVTLMAYASDFAGTVTQVQFLQGSTSLGIVTTAPFNLVWSNATTGNYALTAVATDNYGLGSTSSVVNLFITPLFATNNLLVWLKADAITGLTNNGSISNWPDSSGWSDNASQLTSAQKPFYVTNALNGLPAVQFRGLQFMNLSKFPTVLTQAEAFIVVEATNWSTTAYNYQTLWMFGNGGLPANERYPFYDGSIWENFGSSVTYQLGVPSEPLNQYNVYEVCSQSNNWEAWINRMPLYETTNNTVLFNNPPTLGNSYYPNSFNGNVPEVLVFNRALTASERSTVNNYLNSKYSLVSSVPPTPTNLVATAFSPTQIGLTWSESLTNGAATQIAIERSTASNGPFSVIAEVPDALSYVDTNLAAGTIYYYQVQAINIIQPSPPSNIAQATTLATGANIPFGNLALWLKADSGWGRSGTNVPVSWWPDQSGNGNNAQQMSGANQPLWEPGAIGNLPAIQFNGTSSYFSLPNFMNTATGGEAFVVLKVSGANGEQALWEIGGYNVGGSQGNIEQEAYPNTDGSISDGFGSTTRQLIGIPLQPLTQYHLFEVSSQTNNWSAWINGVLQYQSTTNTVSFANTPTLGQAQNNNGNNVYSSYFAGNIAEIMIFNRPLTGAERTTVSVYLNGKYSLVPAIPPTPTNLIATAIDPTQISLTWTEPFTNGGATQIAIERSTTSNGTFNVVAEVSDSLSYVDTNLTAGTTYYYQLQAINLTQFSPTSNIAYAMTPTIGASIPFGNLALWLKADGGLGQTSSNNPVNLWLDQSGNGNNAQQATYVNQPIWIPNAIAHLPVIQFNGTNSYFALPSFMSAATAGEAFVVLKVSVTNSEHALWEMGSYGAGGIGDDEQESYPNTDGSISDGFGSISRQPIGIPLQPLTQYHVFEVSSQTNNWQVWINGLLQYQMLTNTVGFGNSPILGTAQDNNGTIVYYSYFAGNIAEVLVFNRSLSADEKVSVGDYLFSKYGLEQYATNALPPGSPTNLVAVGTVPNQLGLTWLPTTTNQIGYILERKVGTNGVYSEIGSTFTNGFSDPNVFCTNQYFYKVLAENFFGDSGYSKEAAPPIVSLTLLSTNAYFIVGSPIVLAVQSFDADYLITQQTIADTFNLSPFAVTTTSGPFTNTWDPPFQEIYSLSGTATDTNGDSWVSLPVTLPVYLSSNTNGIPNYLLVEQGNNPLNPWVPPTGDSNTNPPTINLVVPANATLLP
jgi:hypothetical protein